MKLSSSRSWFAILVFALTGAAAGCAVPLDRSAGDDPAVEGEIEAAVTTCTPNGEDVPGSGSSICNAPSNRFFAEPACCSGRARFWCPSRGESSETFCVP